MLKPIVKLRKLMPSEKKKVCWVPDDRLVSVKVFKMTDEPEARGMTKTEIEKYLKEVELQSANPKIFFQETRMKEKQMEKVAMGRIKEKEIYIRRQMLEMKPDCDWIQPKGNYK